MHPLGGASARVLENARKECAEEASLPPAVLAALRPAGCISYRYAARRGLSTKTLAVFDVELPADLTSEQRRSARCATTRTANREPRTANREPRTANREPRTANCEPRTANRDPRRRAERPTTIEPSSRDPQRPTTHTLLAEEGCMRTPASPRPSAAPRRRRGARAPDRDDRGAAVRSRGGGAAVRSVWQTPIFVAYSHRSKQMVHTTFRGGGPGVCHSSREVLVETEASERWMTMDDPSPLAERCAPRRRHLPRV